MKAKVMQSNEGKANNGKDNETLGTLVAYLLALFYNLITLLCP